MDLMNKYNARVRHLRKLERAYYAGKPLVSDGEYNELRTDLYIMENELAMPEEIRHTNRVGALTVGKRFAHVSRIRSMDAAYSYDELFDKIGFWVDFVEGVLVDYKIDGMAIEAQYCDGQFYKLLTRGDGDAGIDITYNKVYTAGIPDTIDLPGKVAIVGELAFNKLNGTLHFPTQDLRTVVSSLMRNHAPVDMPCRADFIAYDLLAPVKSTHEYYQDTVELLSSFGFRTTAPRFIAWDDFDAYLNEICDDEGSLCGFVTDGICIKIDEYAVREELGVTKHHPKYQIALKWPTPTMETIITGFDETVGEIAGTITPIALIEPITYAGRVYSKINLHSRRLMEASKLKVGDKVTVDFRGGIYPVIVK